MFEKVLFPTDFSQREEILLDCIASIPGVRDVILLHVVKETRYPMGVQIVDTLAKETAENILTVAQDYLKTLNPDIRVTLDTTISPDIAEGILTTAEKRDVDLIVIGAHGKSVKIGVLLGSVPSTVLCRISKTNVLIMRHKIIETLTGKTYEKFCPMLFSRILCPTDFSRFSEHATALVSTMKGVGEVILLHVVPDDGTGSEIKESAQTAEARIGAVRDSLTAQDIRSRAIVTTGNPAGEIVRTAEEQDVSVIWLSSYGKGCLYDFLLGSTVQDVAMKSTRPVIVIRSWE
ncbi:MAG: universal stress protein [Methanoregula sp.]|jgi:nucleotide-binding universal stress UspA family protein|nr:universal stress protein [Methanoregula sp.]